MTQNTVQIAVDKETANYAVYESADEETIVGMYLAEAAAEQVGEFAEIEIDTDGDDAQKSKDTTNYGVYETPTGGINGMYVAHDQLDSEDTDDGPTAPDSIGLTINSSDEETFEEEQGIDEDEIDGLLGDTEGSDSEEDEEETTVDDEALGLVGDE